MKQNELGMAMMQRGPLQHSIDENAFTHAFTL